MHIRTFKAEPIHRTNRSGAPVWEPAADDLNLSSTANDLVLYDPSLTVTGGGHKSLEVGTGSDPLSYHPYETIDATTSGGEQFIFSAGFGNRRYDGFSASGATPDSIQLATSSFSYLTAGMTQAQDLTAVLASGAKNSSSGLTISDSHGDNLTVAGLTPAIVAASPPCSNSPELEIEQRNRAYPAFASCDFKRVARRRERRLNGHAMRRVAAHPQSAASPPAVSAPSDRGCGQFVIVDRAARNLGVEVRGDDIDDIEAHERTRGVHRRARPEPSINPGLAKTL